jgi:hypothetical protein
VNLRPLNVVFGKLSTDFIKIILTEDRQQVKRLIRNNRQTRANKLFHSHLRGTVTERSILQNPSECHCPRAALVTTTDTYGYSDPWHYDSSGYLDLGKQFAVAMHGLQRNHQ